MTTTSRNISLVWFFLVVFIVSLPCYYLIAQPNGITIAWILSLVPLPLALIFAFWEGKGGGLKNLLKRYSVKMPNYVWYIPTILLMPVILLLADRVLGIFRDIPAPVLLVEQLPTLIILLFITATTEEMAWMGYAFDRMEGKWKTIGATLILAIVWIIWHVPAQYLLGLPITGILSFALFMIGWRFLMVWAYKNTGKSSFVATLVHYTGNITQFGVLFGVFTIGYFGFLVLGVVTIIAALIVIFLWGPELNKFRWSR